MGIKSLSTIFKKEEMQVPETDYVHQESNHVHPKKETDATDDFDGINLSFEDDDDDDDDAENLEEGQLNYWEYLMPWGESLNDEEAGNQYQNNYFKNSSSCMFFQEDRHEISIKEEAEAESTEDDEKKLSLNLSLNYQEVLDAWSHRTLWADASSFVTANNAYMGEVPVMEEERKRREASVQRYKQKRQARLFSKKIRYQVRKLNADKRPRFKGRFVKRVAENILK